MIRRLLVPLDGSRFAERALLIAGNLAESVSGELVLVRVVPPPVPGRFYGPNLLDQLQEAQRKEATAYLAATAARLKLDRLVVETHVLLGPAAETIARLAVDSRCDLIVMSLHGLAGAGWRVFGSVAQKVLHTAPCPILIVRPTDAELEGEEEEEELMADDALLHELAESGRTEPGAG